MDRNFEKKFGRIGRSKAYDFPTQEAVAFARMHISETYAEFLNDHGYLMVRSGRFQFCPLDAFRSIVALIFKADPDFSHTDTHIVGYDAFAMEIMAWSERHNALTINLLEYEIYCSALAPSIFAFQHPLLKDMPKREVTKDSLTRSLLPTDEDTGECWDWQGNKMFGQAGLNLGTLEPGQVFGFVPSLGMTGYDSRSRAIENVQRLSALEHFAIASQLKPFQLVRTVKGKKEVVREIG